MNEYGRYERVPLRAKGDRPDGHDDARVQLVMRRWHAQDQAYLGYAKTVEEHIRMLSGRQWDVWSDVYGRFVDVLQFMTENERKHRMRPVMDYLLYWLILTLSKVRENRPQITFHPATADRRDAMLAEVIDPVWKTLFDEMDLDYHVGRMAGWLLVAGEGHFVTRVDFSQGPKRQLIAPAVLRLDRDGMPPIERHARAVPYDRDGNPLAKLVPDPEQEGEYGYDVTGDPYEDQEGVPRIDVFCPLQVRAQWGTHISWRDKRWIETETFLLPEQIHEQFGVKCEPDSYVGNDESGPGYLERMLFGSGYFGAARGDVAAQHTSTDARLEEGYIRVVTMWEKPIPGFTPETEESAGGRLLVVAPGSQKVLWDSERPFKTQCAGPIRRVAFVEIPGRPHGTTILERGVPLQKRLNRIEAHISQHTNLVTDPILMIHEAAGIDDDEWVAHPGQRITHGYNGPGDAAKYLAPPSLSSDVYKEKADVRDQLFVILAMAGNQSEAPTTDASGELVEQLRINADRPLVPLTSNLTHGLAGVAEDVLAVLPKIWTQEKLVSYAGSDNVVRTITVLPEMFDGRVNIKPVVEAAAPESKDKQRQRLLALFQLGAFGNLQDPKEQKQAIAHLMDLLQLPNLARAARPGGEDRVMAEFNLGRLVRGDPAEPIPLLEVYDFTVHLDVIDRHMKTPEYLQLDLEKQTQFVVYRERLEQAFEAQQINMLAKATTLKQAAAAAEGTVATTAALTSPQPPAGAKPGAGPGAKKPPASADTRAA